MQEIFVVGFTNTVWRSKRWEPLKHYKYLVLLVQCRTDINANNFLINFCASVDENKYFNPTVCFLIRLLTASSDSKFIILKIESFIQAPKVKHFFAILTFYYISGWFREIRNLVLEFETHCFENEQEVYKWLRLDRCVGSTAVSGWHYWKSYYCVVQYFVWRHV
jgi:hypothetical protein